MDFIEIESTSDYVQKKLSVLSKSMKSIQRGLLGVIGRDAIKEINKNTKSIKGNGFIAGKYPYSVANSFVYSVSRDANKLSIYPKAIEQGLKNDLTIPVFSTLNYGKTIKPRNGKPYLTIHLKTGDWRKVRSVQIHGLHFIEQGKKFIENENYIQDVEKYIEKELKKAGF